MKTRIKITIGAIAIFAGIILLSSFSIQKDDQSYVLFCNHWVFSGHKSCTVLWNESEQTTSTIIPAMSEKSWDHLLSIPREQALNELQQKFDKYEKFFMDVTITGLKDSYVIGEKPIFAVVQAGYGIPCIQPHVVVFKNGEDKPHWEYNFVHSCPFFRDGSPILSSMSVPHNNVILLPITEPGQYTITASSSYDSSASKQFVVYDSDFVYDYTISYSKQGNNTGNTLLTIDLNNGNYTLRHNSQSIQNKLSDDELNQLKKSIDENDLLRGYSSVSHDTDPTCSTCVNYKMSISLGDYTHFVQWQNDKDGIRQYHIAVIEILEKLLDNINKNLSDK